MVNQRPVVTVDVLIRKDNGYVFIKRKNEPYKGQWAIPGGILEYGENVEQAAKREAKEETGLDVKLIRLVGVYSHPTRDLREPYISTSYLAEAISGELKAATDAKNAKIFKRTLDNLAFDQRSWRTRLENKQRIMNSRLIYQQ